MPKIGSTAELEEVLSRPSDLAVEALSRLAGDILVLGVGGKMGPTLARMARRASDLGGVNRRVIGVSRFSSGGLEAQLNACGVETIQCNLTDNEQLRRLPDVPNIVYMAGMKFGATGNEPLTWMMNVFVPGMVCQRFLNSSIVAFSTGNVYGLSPVVRGGSVETDPLRPVGEYAITSLGRERMFEHFSRAMQIPMAILRLNYAQDLRYGVLVDIARAVWNQHPVDLAMGYFNAIWQGDANAMALCALDHVASPPLVLNIAGPEQLSVRSVSEEFARRFGKPIRFIGREGHDALLSNSLRAQRLFGKPCSGPEQMIEWVADWIRRGGEHLGKPTHFENREGTF